MADNEKKELETVEEAKPAKQEKAKKKDKPSIFSRIAAWFRSCKSEIKKIVWPGWKDVVKNTVIVLIMCLIIGVFIWLVDFGLGKLLTLILGA